MQASREPSDFGYDEMPPMHIRPMTEDDRYEVAELIYASINTWYQSHALPPGFRGGPRVAEVFYDVYSVLDPGCALVAENPDTGRLAGSCFYHPRARHVSLGIMNVHPNYFGQGAGRALLQEIINYTEQHGYNALRLVQSALNLDSFSLYNKAGFVPRYAYQDMVIAVPKSGLDFRTPDLDRVRDATLDDVPGMLALEREVSGITREQDYRYFIENALGFWHISVHENDGGGIEGFLASCGHPAMNMIGPGVSRTEGQAAALLLHELDQHRGRSPVFVVPVEKDKLVQRLYGWGARNCELHFCQVRGEFQPYRGVNLPTYLPETA